ncbi:sulfur relay protein TusC [Pasteurella multocida subsp. multocida OH4807]|nr:sulfur relay protein TusC [Pasteurella multocida subsp. multocida OH4807]
MIKLAFVFRSAPHGTSSCREGLEALLAATAFCQEEDIAVFFLDDGVFNLLSEQQPECILQKDFIRTFKLLELYDIEQRYICRESLARVGLETQPLILYCETLDRTELVEKLQQAEKVLTF